MAAANDPYAHIEGDEDYIKVSLSEGEEFMEIPKEEDGTVMLSTIQTQFPDAIGLKCKGSSGAWRAIRAVDNILAVPKGEWGDQVYYITVSDTYKRKSGSFNNVTKESKIARPTVNPLLQDIAVMGLPFKTTIEELREYFENTYGELTYSEIKFDKATGKSRGFGFIRFKDELAAKEALSVEHYMEGRKVELRQKKDKPLKLFIGRLQNGTTREDLDKYFSQYGELKDTYIPTPFRNFAFITFASTEDGRICLRESHELNGARLNVMERNPDKKLLNTDDDKRQSSFAEYGTSSRNIADNGTHQQPDDSDTALKNMLFKFLTNN